MNRDTVLIVDDNHINRTILRKMLCDEYRVAEANDGTAALDTLDKLREQVCVMILDIWMPLLDGIGVLTAMRNKGWLGTIPVVVITSDATAEMESRLLTFGVKYMIPKPFDPVIVRDCVRDAIQNQGSDGYGQMLYDEAYRQKNLLTRVNTFLYEYDHATGVSHIDARYKKCLRGDWNAFRLDQPECVRDAVYRPDYQVFLDFIKLDCGGAYETLDVRLLTSSGGYEWFRIGKLYYADERGPHTVLAFSNVSNEMRARERLDFLSHSDSLTQIPNQQAFIDNTRVMILEHEDTPFTLLIMGIDRFITFNQLYGRDEGDKLLKYVAVRLQECVEADPMGTYCRLQVDDFAACVPRQIGGVNAMISELQTMLDVYPINFEITLNFGLVQIDDSSMLIDDLIERARVAQQTVRGNYSRHVALYDKALREQDELKRMITTDMKEALRQGQFVMYLQPKCDMCTGRIVGSEALVRWMHPARGLIPPGAFIPLFEQCGFISELDSFILAQACKTIRSWIDRGIPAHPISVNVSRVDLYNPYLVDEILKTVNQYGVPHELIGFEMTESSFVVDNSIVRELTETLKKNGFCVLMDDFGSGYSSLNTLKDVLVNVLKIDLRFLQSTNDVERANYILCSICKMAQGIHLDIIMEGVETAAQARLLTSIGVTCAQGFLYYRPMPVDEYEKRLCDEIKTPPQTEPQ